MNGDSNWSCNWSAIPSCRVKFPLSDRADKTIDKFCVGFRLDVDIAYVPVGSNVDRESPATRQMGGSVWPKIRRDRLYEDGRMCNPVDQRIRCEERSRRLSRSDCSCHRRCEGCWRSLDRYRCACCAINGYVAC